MSIEIVAHEVCPTCKGTGGWEQQTVLGPIIGPCHMCDEKTHTVPRVLATFADAAEMIDLASGAETMDLGRVGPVVARSVLAALGVTDEH